MQVARVAEGGILKLKFTICVQGDRKESGTISGFDQIYSNFKQNLFAEYFSFLFLITSQGFFTPICQNHENSFPRFSNLFGNTIQSIALCFCQQKYQYRAKHGSAWLALNTMQDLSIWGYSNLVAVPLFCSLMVRNVRRSSSLSCLCTCKRHSRMTYNITISQNNMFGRRCRCKQFKAQAHTLHGPTLLNSPLFFWISWCWNWAYSTALLYFGSTKCPSFDQTVQTKFFCCWMGVCLFHQNGLGVRFKPAKLCRLMKTKLQ